MCHFLIALVLCLAASMSQAQEAAPKTDAKPLIAKAVAAAGGEAKLLKLFRIKEIYHFGDKPEPAEGKKKSTRVSVLEPPKYWWVGKADRTDEPAKFDVWGWTLGALLDAQSQVEGVADVTESGRPAYGLRVSGTVTPPMELYFDQETSLLVRMDWRNDIYRYSDTREHDGVKYPAKCIIYKKVGDKPWFYHEITELERLKELPEGVKRQ
jgi:hypothetical protein